MECWDESTNTTSPVLHYPISYPISPTPRAQTTMSKNVFCLALCAMLYALCSTATAQQATKIPRIGHLNTATLSAIAERIEAFRQGLRELGYVDGKNIVIGVSR
jgi:hypothetical protein